MNIWAQYIQPLLPLITIALGAIIAGAFASRNRKKQNEGEALRLAPATATEMWDRIDELDQRIRDSEAREVKRTKAFTDILAAIAAQWTQPTPPTLPTKAVDVLSDTIPIGWLPKR